MMTQSWPSSWSHNQPEEQPHYSMDRANGSFRATREELVRSKNLEPKVRNHEPTLEYRFSSFAKKTATLKYQLRSDHILGINNLRPISRRIDELEAGSEPQFPEDKRSAPRLQAVSTSYDVISVGTPERFPSVLARVCSRAQSAL